MDRQALASEVAQKTGISQSEAERAVEVVVNELSSHLPGPIGSHLQSFLGSGSGGGGPELGDIASRIGKAFGK